MKRDKTNTRASAAIIHDSMEEGAAMATVSTPTTRSTIVVANAEEREGVAMGADSPILFTSQMGFTAPHQPAACSCCHVDAISPLFQQLSLETMSRPF